MAGFGATIRAGAGAIALTAIAAFVSRVMAELLPFLKASPAAGQNAPKGVSRTIQFVEIASGRFLLILLLSVVIMWLGKSYLNSEVRV
jgi:hypothetical protein